MDVEKRKIEVGQKPDEDVPSRPAKKNGWISRITAYKYAASNVRHLKKRASFPLLRKVIRDEATAQRTSVPCADIRSELLQRTMVGHQFLFVFFAGVSVWALLCFLRGLHGAIRYDDWLNNWLILGAPLLVIGIFRCLASFKIQAVCLNELNHRQHAKGSFAPEVE